MKEYYIEVSVNWTQSTEANNKKEAFKRTADTFEDEFGFRPTNKEMTIIK